MLLSFQKYMTEMFVLQCSDSYLESKPWVLIQKKPTKKTSHCEQQKTSPPSFTPFIAAGDTVCFYWVGLNFIKQRMPCLLF